MDKKHHVITRQFGSEESRISPRITVSGEGNADNVSEVLNALKDHSVLEHTASVSTRKILDKVETIRSSFNVSLGFKRHDDADKAYKHLGGI